MSHDDTDTDTQTGTDVHERPSDEHIEEIEAERQRRLDPENRPENAEIDNSGAELPTVREFADREAAEAGDDDPASTADPSAVFRENPPSEEEVKEIEAERERRLHPENRPDNTEVDNTDKPLPELPEG